MSQHSFIHGFHAIIAKLRHQPDAIVEIYIDAERHDARVRDLMRHAELQAVKVVAVDAKRESYPFGKFGWFTDPEGNRVELWQPVEAG